MTKQSRLDSLKKRIAKDQRGSSLQGGAIQLVFGSGDINAKVVFIGEAPGRKEDETGKPFVGASGKFLDKMLDSIELKRDDVYITNIVKYRPPENRDPTKIEKQDFMPYLLEQINIIKPDVVVTLGRHSGQVFIPDLCIGDDHGNPVSLDSLFTSESKQDDGKPIIVLPLYHPAAALYNGSLKSKLLTDFKIIKKLIA